MIRTHWHHLKARIVRWAARRSLTAMEAGRLGPDVDIPRAVAFRDVTETQYADTAEALQHHRAGVR